MLEILNQSEDSVSFRQPVNFEQVPNYPLVVDQRMDLQTVGEKLQGGHYATPSEFAKDIRLIFANSKIFKPNRNSDMYAMTDRLSSLFEKYFYNILATYETHKTASECKYQLFLLKLSFVNLKFFCFVGKSDCLHSKDTESMKGIPFVPTNSNKGIQTANDSESSKETIVSSRANKRQKVRNRIPS